ncbi:hypothetical protein TYRP_017719 [Tyrophagus putrescentiae]|nr:hypothetical protein TYRP_017719 [Tyrophagus putrescentiae]
MTKKVLLLIPAANSLLEGGNHLEDVCVSEEVLQRHFDLLGEERLPEDQSKAEHDRPSEGADHGALQLKDLNQQLKEGLNQIGLVKLLAQAKSKRLHRLEAVAAKE